MAGLWQRETKRLQMNESIFRQQYGRVAPQSFNSGPPQNIMTNSVTHNPNANRTEPSRVISSPRHRVAEPAAGIQGSRWLRFQRTTPFRSSVQRFSKVEAVQASQSFLGQV
eukprot:3508953-Prymnesium_polylepis.1